MLNKPTAEQFYKTAVDSAQYARDKALEVAAKMEQEQKSPTPYEMNFATLSALLSISLELEAMHIAYAGPVHPSFVDDDTPPEPITDDDSFGVTNF